MRIAEEILERIKVEQQDDILGLAIGDLIGVLTFEEAKSIREKDITKEDWGDVLSRDVENVKKRLVGYLPFAIEKALGHRGISSSRSVAHMRNYVWLIGDDEALKFVEDSSNYPQYGVPVLKYLADRYNFDYRNILDEEELRMFLNMSKGLSCEEGCNMGCGR